MCYLARKLSPLAVCCKLELNCSNLAEQVLNTKHDLTNYCRLIKKIFKLEFESKTIYHFITRHFILR